MSGTSQFDDRADCGAHVFHHGDSIAPSHHGWTGKLSLDVEPDTGMIETVDVSPVLRVGPCSYLRAYPVSRALRIKFSSRWSIQLKKAQSKVDI
jgi:hypothetical protein